MEPKMINVLFSKDAMFILSKNSLNTIGRKYTSPQSHNQTNGFQNIEFEHYLKILFTFLIFTILWKKSLNDLSGFDSKRYN